MKKNSYSEFVIKHKEHLRDLAQVQWWRFEQEGTGWFIKGFCETEKNSRYCLLLTNCSRVYFSSAGASQIKREIQEYNPSIIGGVSGVLPILQDCIQKFDEKVNYSMVKESCALELTTLVKGMFQFKWCFGLEKLKRDIGKKIIEKSLLFPLVNTVLAYESSVKPLEEQTRRKLDLDHHLSENQRLVPFSATTNEMLTAGSLSSIKFEELKLPKKAQAPREEPQAAAKRKPSPPRLEEKREKPSEYKETTEEAKRKLDIQMKLGKKKEKRKLDFL